MKGGFKTLTLTKEHISKITNIEIGEIIGIDYIQKENSNLCKEILVTFVDKDYKHAEFLTKEDWVKENVVNKIPKHVLIEVPKNEFLDYVESVFLKIESVDEIYIPAAVSFLKLKFMSGIIDIDSAVIMIKNQCRK
jgi:hypothetical protein